MDRARRVGANIKRFRELAGLSKSELARQVKVSPTAVNNWEENGVMPRAELMFDLGKALEVNFVQLMGRGVALNPVTAEDGEPSPQPDMSRGERLDQFKLQIAALFDVEPAKVEIIVRT